MTKEQRRSKRVMLVENDGGMIRSVRAAIEEDQRLHFVGYLTGRTNLDRFLDDHAPDVALIDVGLMRPGDNLGGLQDESFDEGLRIISFISEHSPHTKIIGFSNNFMVLPALTKEALERGADALIAKQNGPAEWRAWTDWLCSQLHAVLDGWWRFSPEVAELLQDQEEEVRRRHPDGPLPLTQRQMEVLRLMAAGKSDREIAEELSIEEGAVRGHISNIKKRMQLHQRWQVIDEARRHGYGGNTDTLAR